MSIPGSSALAPKVGVGLPAGSTASPSTSCSPPAHFVLTSSRGPDTGRPPPGAPWARPR